MDKSTNYINVNALTGRRGTHRGTWAVEIYAGRGRTYLPVKNAVLAHFEKFSGFSKSTVKMPLPQGGWLLPEGGSIIPYHKEGEKSHITVPPGSTVTVVGNGNAYCDGVVAVVRAGYNYNQHV